MVQLTMPNPHGRGLRPEPNESIFTIKFLSWIVGPKGQRWYKYVFARCVGRKVYFGGDTLVWILSSW